MKKLRLVAVARVDSDDWRHAVSAVSVELEIYFQRKLRHEELKLMRVGNFSFSLFFFISCCCFCIVSCVLYLFFCTTKERGIEITQNTRPDADQLDKYPSGLENYVKMFVFSQLYSFALI